MSTEQQPISLARDGSSLYYSLALLSDEKKQAVTPLYACIQELYRIRNISSEPAIAQNKLDWWRTEIGRSYSGTAQHPVARTLQATLQQFDLPHEYFLEIIDGLEMDIMTTSYPDHASLLLYAQRTTASVNLLATEIYGYQDRKTLKSVEMFGQAVHRIQLIQNLRTDLQYGRIYLPVDEQQKHGVTASDFTSPVITDAMQHLLSTQAQWARDSINTAMSQLPDSDRYSQLAHLIHVNLQLALLDEIENDGFKVLQHQTRLTPLRKLWIAWRTRRHEKKLAGRSA